MKTIEETAMAYAKKHGFNAISKLDVKDRVVFSLYLEMDGIQVPIGLPFLIEIINGQPIMLPQIECDDIISLLQE